MTCFAPLRLSSLSGPLSRNKMRGDDLQLLGHEELLVSRRMVLERSKDVISEFFVKRWRLKTEGVEESISAAALDRIEFSPLH
jgi:hypothetical protein